MAAFDDGMGAVVMGIGQAIRKLTDRARGRIRPEQAEGGIDKAADKLNEATGSKYASKVNKAQEKAKGAANKYLGKQE